MVSVDFVVFGRRGSSSGQIADISLDNPRATIKVAPSTAGPMGGPIEECALFMLIGKSVGIIGSGNMGEALINGLVSSALIESGRIHCADVRRDRLEALKARFGINTTTDNREVIAASDVIIYAVKPQIIANVIKETAGDLDKSKLVVSIAAGVSLAGLRLLFKKELRMVRVMPNICAAFGEAASAIAGGKGARHDDIETVMAIFNSVGRCVVLPNDHLMDAETGLSGSGPAYVFVIAEALADAGVRVGLARPEARTLAAQTLLGAARMLLESNMHPGHLKDMVTSPGGTSIAGLHALEKGGLRAALFDAVEAATRRSSELGALINKDIENQTD